jgi:DNA-binding beta-propeller fold protein YncE
VSDIAKGMVLGALALWASAAHAQGIAFTHTGTISSDGKGVALKAPEGVACVGNGSVVIADTGNARLLTVGMKEDGSVGAVTELKLAELPYPTRVRAMKDGSLLVLDRKKKKVARVEKGQVVGYVEVPGEQPGKVLVGAFGVDGAGTVYLLDIARNVIWAVDPAAAKPRTIALPSPREAIITDLSADEDGSIYAVDTLGTKVWVARKGEAALAPLSKELKDVMSFPAYVLVSGGRLYVVDQHGCGIVVLGMDGTFLGRRLSIGWNEGLVRYPAQICLDETHHLYVADRQNNRVQAFSTQ